MQRKKALQIPAVIKPQMTDVGPPLGSARFRDADRAVQEFKMAKASPSIARGLKWRLSSALWPIDSYKTVHSASSSAVATSGTIRRDRELKLLEHVPWYIEWKIETLIQDVPSERHRQTRGSVVFPLPYLGNSVACSEKQWEGDGEGRKDGN